MNGTRGAFGGEEKRLQAFGGVTWTKKATLETQALMGV